MGLLGYSVAVEVECWALTSRPAPERPRPNLNPGVGFDVSPAVREYLGLADIDICDWKFVES
jgi:hypothetical protein